MAEAASGGRTWWAHFEFTPINIEPTILRKKIEDLRPMGRVFSDQWSKSTRTVTCVNPSRFARVYARV